eukprot:5657247-Alexandrium_andersonii.AAC.1
MCIRDSRDTCICGSVATSAANPEACGGRAEGVEVREGFPALGAADQGSKRLRITAPRAKSKNTDRPGGCRPLERRGH